jgi:hypothetical protein
MFSVGQIVRHHWVTVRCPACGFDNDVQMLQASLRERALCRGCHIRIQLDDHDVSIVVTTDAADRALDDLRDTLRRLGE